MNLHWNRCQGDMWCPLNTVNLTHQHFANMAGVLIVWHGGTAPATVYVGQGRIKERIEQLRTDTEVQAFLPFGLFATWASVSSESRDGTEAFLIDKLKPKVKRQRPTAEQIAVNLPWNT